MCFLPFSVLPLLGKTERRNILIIHNKNGCFTFREEPISVLYKRLNDGDHMHRCSCCHLCQRSECDHRQTDRKLHQPQLHFVFRTFTQICSSRTEFLPLILCPEQVGPQDYGDVAGSHLIYFTVLSQFSQKLHQISATETSTALKTSKILQLFNTGLANWYSKLMLIKLTGSWLLVKWSAGLM